MKITFKDEAHKAFFMEAQTYCKVWDSYHKALFYVLGICPDCRIHITDIFNFKADQDNYGIKPDTVFEQGWQTSGSLDCIRMGYNLFNGYTDKETSPYDLFSGEYAPYLLEAVKLRYPDSFTQDLYQLENENGDILEVDLPLFLAKSYLQVYEKNYGGTYTIKPKAEIYMEV